MKAVFRGIDFRRMNRGKRIGWRGSSKFLERNINWALRWRGKGGFESQFEHQVLAATYKGPRSLLYLVTLTENLDKSQSNIFIENRFFSHNIFWIWILFPQPLQDSHHFPIHPNPYLLFLPLIKIKEGI